MSRDVDLVSAVPMLVFSGIMNTGQACVAQTRILAPRSRYDEIVDAVSNFVQMLPVGKPDGPAAQVGSLISEKQRGWCAAAAVPRAWTVASSCSPLSSPTSTTR